MRKFTALMSTARVLAAGAMLMASGSAMAANLVQNGSFESNGGVGQIGSVTSLNNWSVGAATDGTTIPFDFVLDANADSTGFNSSTGTIRIWGPNTPTGVSNFSYSNPNPHNVGPVANGWPGTIPNGSYVFGADAAYANAPISQTINGLTAGNEYDLTFSYAGAQFTDALGANQQGWHVTLGGDVNKDTGDNPNGDLSNPSEGFTGWHTFSYTFTASTTSETLTFLANGGPSGLPPFALLDNVSITGHMDPPPPSPVPEPSTIVLVGSSLFLIGAARSFRKKNAPAA